MHACALASRAEDAAAAAAAAASCSPRAAPAVLDVNTCAPLQHAKKNEVRAEAARKKQEEAAAAAAKDARVSTSPRSTDKSAPRSTDKNAPRAPSGNAARYTPRGMVYTMAQLDYPVQNMLDKVWGHCEWGASLCRTHKSTIS